MINTSGRVTSVSGMLKRYLGNSRGVEAPGPRMFQWLSMVSVKSPERLLAPCCNKITSCQLWKVRRIESFPRGDSTGNFLDFSSAASFRQQRFFVSSEYSSAAIFQRRDFVVRNSSEGVIKSSISLFIIPIQFLFTYSCRYVDMFKDGLLLSSYSSLFERPVFGNTLIFLDFECMANSITLMCKLDIA